MKITCVLPTLGHGGAQKILITVAEYLSYECNYDVDILVLGSPETTFYQPRKIPVHYLECFTYKPNIPSLINASIKIRDLLMKRQPDVTISFMDIANIPTLVAGIFGVRTKVIVSERQDPNYYKFKTVRSILRSLLYRSCWRVVVQTKSIADQMPSCIQKNVRIIPNPVDLSNKCFGKFSDRSKTILLVGRLESQKNYELFLSSVALRKNELEGWKIKIYGHGTLQKKISDLISQLQLQDTVFLCGVTHDIESIMRDAQIYVLPSLYEGFPNTLAEAVSNRVPSIAFKDVSGTEDLIFHRYNGLLIDQTSNKQESLAKAITELAFDVKYREYLSANATDISINFSGQTVLPKWNHLITSS